MDFKKFQQWCQDKGFIITLPSGYTQLMGLDVKSFEQFKGFFNLCVLFFEEEMPNYSEADFEKVFNYLLTPDRNGIVPMEELLDSLEN